jgi:hypothetical protein
MDGECIVNRFALSVSNIYVRVCGDRVEVGISPSWDSIGRHEYIIIGSVDEVLNGLSKLIEDIMYASKAIEDMVKEVRNRD